MQVNFDLLQGFTASVIVLVISHCSHYASKVSKAFRRASVDQLVGPEITQSITLPGRSVCVCVCVCLCVCMYVCVCVYG